jgi:hypothetical protein
MTSPIHINDIRGGTEGFRAALKSISQDHTPANVQTAVCTLNEEECRTLQTLVFNIENCIYDRVKAHEKSRELEAQAIEKLAEQQVDRHWRSNQIISAALKDGRVGLREKNETK